MWWQSIWHVIAGAWGVLAEMAPYLLFGFVVAGLLRAFLSPAWVERHLGGPSLLAVLKASLLGVPLPLCSCGVIPVAASLHRHGAGRGPVTAFLISTPQTGVDSIFVTYSLLGPIIAIVRPVVAFVSGVIGGFAVGLTPAPTTSDEDPAARKTHGHERVAGAAGPCCEGERVTAGEACCVADAEATGEDACCGDEDEEEHPTVRQRIVRAAGHAFDVLPRDIGRSLLFGVLIAGVISVVVPARALSDWGTGTLGMFVMLGAGIPIYVCATASVPIAAALIAKGVSPGAALVFLMSGPATNAATVTTLWKTLGKAATVIYLLAMAVCALAAGFLLDAILPGNWVPVLQAGEAMSVMWWQHLAAIVLLIVLGRAVAAPHWARWRARCEEAAGSAGTDRMKPEAADGSFVELTVEGMTCEHCAASVRDALQEIPGVSSATVNLSTGRVRITGTDLDSEHLASAVTAAGYEAEPAGA